MDSERYRVYTTKDTIFLTKLEKDILDFSKDYTVHHWRIPAMISGEILEKCGYFESMPNQLTGTGYFDEKNCIEIIEGNKKNNLTFSSENMYLTPAACIHFYPELKKEKLKNELITTNARVYRHEDGKFGRYRLWDFNVREFVAVGSKEFVVNFLQDFRQKALNLTKKYKIKSSIVVANDHFYPSKKNKIKEKVQKVNSLKYELIGNDEVALASFNFHGYHFSKTFDFDEDGKIVTGCVGFGLDRWIELVKNFNSEYRI